MLKEFKAFAMRGNVLDMTVGIFNIDEKLMRFLSSFILSCMKGYINKLIKPN